MTFEEWWENEYTFTGIVNRVSSEEELAREAWNAAREDIFKMDD